MTALLAAGVSAGGALWGVDAAQRLLNLYDATPDRRLRNALVKPLPGDARPLALGEVTLLTEKEVLRLNVRGHQGWMRFDFKTITKEGERMVTRAFEKAWPVSGGGFVAVDAGRMLWAVSTNGKVTPFAAMAVPGGAAVLACDLAKAQVLLADGSRLGLFGSRWVALGASAAADGTASMKVRAITDFCVEAGKDLAVGEVIDLPEKRALELIEHGWVEPAA
jgi:hypothetical protein